MFVNATHFLFLLKISCLLTKQDGSYSCQHLDKEKICPSLKCPLEQRIERDGDCCSYCPGMDFCTLFVHPCHPDALCFNNDTGFQCQCPSGYDGDGYNNCEKAVASSLRSPNLVTVSPLVGRNVYNSVSSHFAKSTISLFLLFRTFTHLL